MVDNKLLGSSRQATEADCWPPGRGSAVRMPSSTRRGQGSRCSTERPYRSEWETLLSGGDSGTNSLKSRPRCKKQGQSELSGGSRCERSATSRSSWRRRDTQRTRSMTYTIMFIIPMKAWWRGTQLDGRWQRVKTRGCCQWSGKDGGTTVEMWNFWNSCAETATTVAKMTWPRSNLLSRDGEQSRWPLKTDCPESQPRNLLRWLSAPRRMWQSAVTRLQRISQFKIIYLYREMNSWIISSRVKCWQWLMSEIRLTSLKCKLSADGFGLFMNKGALSSDETNRVLMRNLQSLNHALNIWTETFQNLKKTMLRWSFSRLMQRQSEEIWNDFRQTETELRAKLTIPSKTTSISSMKTRSSREKWLKLKPRPRPTRIQHSERHWLSRRSQQPRRSTVKPRSRRSRGWDLRSWLKWEVLVWDDISQQANYWDYSVYERINMNHLQHRVHYLLWGPRS